MSTGSASLLEALFLHSTGNKSRCTYWKGEPNIDASPRLQRKPMSILQRRFGARGAVDGRTRAFAALVAEVREFIKALLSPNRLIEEVEQMRALHIAANRVESGNAARAAWLRSRASRIGLRSEAR
ncbi:hypothetical protein [Variovorax sp. RA8]|uniref:hypothetical protein n=1 Tax=Variovorax sp. (strain JCM 16519 / RA8) TaxID=662548 RepID=UPI001E3B75FD|nr:hypothetical protein [Variovorax sp. RA8]